jgi:predicted site-specific integrase-resolvase
LLRIHRMMCDGLPVTTDDLIGTAEAITILGTSRSTLTRWVAAGRITPAVRLPGIRGAILYSRTEIQRLADQRTT